MGGEIRKSEDREDQLGLGSGSATNAYRKRKCVGLCNCVVYDGVKWALKIILTTLNLNMLKLMKTCGHACSHICRF